MTLDAHKLAPLLQSLEALALAGSEVDNAAREQVWDSLSPAARQMAQALFAGRPRESAAAVVTTRPRTSCAVERFPNDVLGAIISFVDLPMRFTCVAACSTFRDACARLSPRLEQSLVLKRFPLLATIGLNGAPAPRELFRTFEDFSLGAFSSRGEALSRAMALGPPLDAYTLWLELELCEQETRLDGRHIWKARESFQIGAGALTDAEEGRYEFTVADAGLYERISQVVHNNVDVNWTIRAVVVATRRNALGQLQFAEIYRDFLTDTSLTGQGASIMRFDGYDIPIDENNIALEYITRYLIDRDTWMIPCLHIDWRSASPSTIHAYWKWSVPDTWQDMNGPEASFMLEHFPDWR
jgi:hypothetical protein